MQELPQVRDLVHFALFVATSPIPLCLALWGMSKEETIRQAKLRTRDRLIGGKGWEALEQVNYDLYHAYLRRDRHEPAYLRDE